MIRVNRIVNPNFDTGSIGGWLASDCTVEVVGGVLRVTPTATACEVASDPVPASAGQYAAVTAYMSGSGTMAVFPRAYGAALAAAGVDLSPTYTAGAAWKRRNAVQLPVGTETIRFVARWQGLSLTTPAPVLGLDKALGLLGDTAADVGDLSYFDGDTPSTEFVSYSWEGQRGSSRSIRADRPSVSVPFGAAPLVQIAIPAVAAPAGVEWRLTGTDGSVSWDVRGGQGSWSGVQTVLADALAPINEPIWYEFAWGDSAVKSATVVRQYGGRGLITSARGLSPVDCLITGKDETELDMRVTSHTVPNRSLTVDVSAPVMGAGGGSLEVLTSQPDTSVLASLLSRPGVFLVFHNPLHCDIPFCDIDPVRVMRAVSVSNSRTDHISQATRKWSIDYKRATIPEPSVVAAASTWDDFDARNLTWNDVDGLGLTWDQFDRTIWQEVSV